MSWTNMDDRTASRRRSSSFSSRTCRTGCSSSVAGERLEPSIAEALERHLLLCSTCQFQMNDMVESAPATTGLRTEVRTMPGIEKGDAASLLGTRLRYIVAEIERLAASGERDTPAGRRLTRRFEVEIRKRRKKLAAILCAARAA